MNNKIIFTITEPTLEVKYPPSIIDEVATIPGLNLLQITPENFEFCLFYLPSVKEAYKDRIAAATFQRDTLKAELRDIERRERLHLLEKKQEAAAGGGPSGVRLDVETIKFLATRSVQAIDTIRLISMWDREISQLWGTYASLDDANAIALSYQGRARAEVGAGLAQHRISHKFERAERIEQLRPIEMMNRGDAAAPVDFELPELE